jgi:hypothetical protein
MRMLVAIVAAFAVLLLGGLNGTVLHGGHSYGPGQLVADGENGAGG